MAGRKSTVQVALPDITKAQVLAAVSWVVAQVVALGWIDNNTGAIIVQASSTLISMVWIIGDAYLRGKRNEARASMVVAGHPDPALTHARSH